MNESITLPNHHYYDHAEPNLWRGCSGLFYQPVYIYIYVYIRIHAYIYIHEMHIFRLHTCVEWLFRSVSLSCIYVYMYIQMYPYIWIYIYLKCIYLDYIYVWRGCSDPFYQPVYIYTCIHVFTNS